MLLPQASIDESTLELTHPIARARALLPQFPSNYCVGIHQVFLCRCVIRVLCDSCADAWDSQVPMNHTTCSRSAGQYEPQDTYCPLQHDLPRIKIHFKSITQRTSRYKHISGLRNDLGNFRDFYLLSLLDNEGCLWMFRESLWGQLAKSNGRSTWFLLERVDGWTPKNLRNHLMRNARWIG